MNLLNLLKYQLGSSLNEQVSEFLGEQPLQIQTALDAVLPSLMSVLVRKGANEQGVSELLQTIQNERHDGSMLNYLSGLFSGGSSTDSLMRTGERLSNRFLGNKKSLMVETVSEYSGLQRNSSSSLIKMAFPLIFGVIGKQVKNQNLDEQGLSNLLSTQKGHIGASIPPGFANMNIFQQSQASSPPPPKKEATAFQNHSPQIAISNSPTNWMKYLPFGLMGILGCIILAFFIRGWNNDGNEITQQTEEKSAVINPIPEIEEEIMTPVAKEEIKEEPVSVEPKKEEPKPIVEPKPEPLLKKKEETKPKPKAETPPSSHSNYTPGETKNKISSHLNSGKIIDFSELQFRGSSAMIRKSSRGQIKELAAVLKENPDRKIKILSKNNIRAISLKKGLMDSGISRNRIETGKGETSHIQLSFY